MLQKLRLSKEGVVAISLAGLLVVILLIWLWWRSPNSEAVFWQTLERNLQVSNLGLSTRITTSEFKGKLLLDNQLQFDFIPSQLAGSFQQRALTYDQDINQKYINFEQARQHTQFLKDNPQINQALEQEWYTQDLISSDKKLYFKHSFYSQPRNSSWEQLYRLDQTNQPIDNQWRQINLNLIKIGSLNFQHFMMSSSVSSGFMFANLNYEQRQQLLNHLKEAYELDWQAFKKEWRQGRLIYSYQFKINYQEFAQAFKLYYNFHLPDIKANLSLTESQALNFFRSQESGVYEVEIDAHARRILNIKQPHPILNFQTPIAYSLNDDLAVIYNYSDMINMIFTRSLNPQINTETKINYQGLKGTHIKPPQD